MPESGREGCCESGRYEGKIQQQGEVRSGQAFLKAAFVTWQQQSYKPFIFSSSIELLSANRSEPKQPCLLPRVWLGELAPLWQVSTRAACVCACTCAPVLLTEPCTNLGVFKSYKSVAHVHHQLCGVSRQSSLSEGRGNDQGGCLGLVCCPAALWQIKGAHRAAPSPVLQSLAPGRFFRACQS